jgi:aspartate beta-hydroxylase
MSTPIAEPAALEAEALRRYQSQDMAGATRLFETLLAEHPTHATALAFLGFAAGQRGDYAAAADYYRRAAQANPNDPTSFFNLAMAELGAARVREAVSALDAALAVESNFLGAWLQKGAAHERLNETEAATRAYLRATRLAEQIPVAQIDMDTRRFLNHALGVVRRELDAELTRVLAPLIAAHGAEAVRRIQGGADIFSGKAPPRFAHPKWRPGLFYVPDLPPQPWYEREDFDWVERVEAATDVIREELLAVMGDTRGFAPYVNHPEGSRNAAIWKGINRSWDWNTFHFWRHGEKIEENCARCPRTTEVLESIDLMRVPGYGPEVMFSVLRPHSRIPPHYGTVNGRLIVHLPLIVPENCGALRADTEARAWVEGKLFMFDDSFEHEAWNDSDETRVVLIFDTWNPHLSPAEREAFRAVLGAAQRFERAAVGA